MSGKPANFEEAEIIGREADELKEGQPRPGGAGDRINSTRAERATASATATTSSPQSMTNRRVFDCVLIPPPPAGVPSPAQVRARRGKVTASTAAPARASQTSHGRPLSDSSDSDVVVRAPKRKQIASDSRAPSDGLARASTSNASAARSDQRKSNKFNDRQKRKVTLAQREARWAPKARSASDSDDLSLSGKETVVKEKLRPTKSKTSKRDQGLAALRAQREAKRQLAAAPKVVHGSSSEFGTESDAQPKKLQPKYAGAPSSSSGSGSGSGSGESGSSDDDLDGFITDASADDSESERVRREMDELNERNQQLKQGINFHLQGFIQWLVHVNVCPAVDWLARDDHFREAQRAVENFVGPSSGSLISSQVWTAAFRRAIDQRPEWDYSPIGHKSDEVVPRCDACHLGNHKHATFRGTFKGRKYNRKTFRDIASDEESDEDEPRLSFHLAGNCTQKSVAYHSTLHWPRHAFGRVAHLLRTRQQPLPPRPVNFSRLTDERKRLIRHDERVRLENEAGRCATLLDSEGHILAIANEFKQLIRKNEATFAS